MDCFATLCKHVFDLYNCSASVFWYQCKHVLKVNYFDFCFAITLGTHCFTIKTDSVIPCDPSVMHQQSVVATPVPCQVFWLDVDGHFLFFLSGWCMTVTICHMPCWPETLVLINFDIYNFFGLGTCNLYSLCDWLDVNVFFPYMIFCLYLQDDACLQVDVFLPRDATLPCWPEKWVRMPFWDLLHLTFEIYKFSVLVPGTYIASVASSMMIAFFPDMFFFSVPSGIWVPPGWCGTAPRCHVAVLAWEMSTDAILRSITPDIWDI